MDMCPNISRLRTHAASISINTITVLERFVDGFSSRCPQAKRVFRLKSKSQQFDAAATISTVMKNMHVPGMMRPWLAGEGHWLSGCGFTAADAPAACEAMIDAIRSVSGVNWSVQIENDWRMLLASVLAMMAEGMPEEAQGRPTRMAA